MKIVLSTLSRLIFIVIFINIILGEEHRSSDDNDYSLWLENTLPNLTLLEPSEHDLQDFFWTGSGDGPPPPKDIHPNKPDTHTITTVIQTVYINPNDSYVTTSEDGDFLGTSLPDGLQSGLEDERYWLLTVIHGSTPDSLQMKLAKLYKLAFLRQQERHLGLVKVDSSLVNSRKKHEVNVVQNSIQNFSNYLWHTSVIHNADLYSTSNTTPSSYSENDVVEPSGVELSNTWVLATPYLAAEKFDFDNETLELYGEGLNYSVLLKREIIKPEEQPAVTVFIRNVTKRENEVEIIYVVFVGGRAVPAHVAARDMRLVRDGEVALELGYPVTTKAEPYVKTVEISPNDSDSTSHIQTWMIITGAIVAALLLIVLLFTVCRMARRKKAASSPSLHSYRNELLRAAQQAQMKQLYDGREEKLVSVISSSKTRPSSTALPVYREGSITSSSSGSGLSEIASALKRRHKRIQKARTKKVGAVDSVNSSPRDSPYSVHGTISPTSFLSMPSIRSFPRTISVEPLSKVLQPVSVKHLDIETPSYEHYTLYKREFYNSGDNRTFHEKSVDIQRVEGERNGRNVTKVSRKGIVPQKSGSHQLVRLGSMDKDPGVIGPPVWSLHKATANEAAKYDAPTAVKEKEGAKMAAMRQRFNELMDDSTSLFGSRVSTPVSRMSGSTGGGYHDTKAPEGINQAHNENVVIPKLRTEFPYSISPRPSTSVSPPPRLGANIGRPSTSTGPKRLIVSDAPRRPPMVPRINPAFVTASGSLQDDPAYPVINAIKSEITRIRNQRTLD